MNDQAQKLRQVIDNLKMRQVSSHENLLPSIKKKNARVITIASGKGGVGKTVITINLAIALSELGLRVVIIDADFGLANIDVLFGIIPQYTLVDVIKKGKSLSDVLCDGPSNIKFISGGSGVEELVRLEKGHLDFFINSIEQLDKIADVILVDTAAGLSDNVMSFAMAADEILLVATPEPTSITDAYALIKMVSNRDKSKVIKVIINKVESTGEAVDILNKLSLVAEKFLSLKLNPLGYILNDDSVVKAVKLQQPFSIGYPKSNASRLIRDISLKLIQEKVNSDGTENNGIKAFVKKLVSFLNNV